MDWISIVIDVTVKIPEDRVAEFYALVGSWLSGDGSVNPGHSTEDTSGPGSSDWDSEADLALAESIWEKLSPRARGLFSTLLDNPGQRFTGDELAASLDIPNGKHGVAGVLAWPGRFCAAARRPLPCRYEDGPAGGSASYWMDVDVADLFDRARHGR